MELDGGSVYQKMLMPKWSCTVPLRLRSPRFSGIQNRILDFVGTSGLLSQCCSVSSAPWPFSGCAVTETPDHAETVCNGPYEAFTVAHSLFLGEV